jgi:glycosyltransferase involved in cell wall biosynthesis
MSPTPALSIVIPTHNRKAILTKTLAAIGRQSWPMTKFEVLVVADACQDDTEQMVEAHTAQVPYELRLLSHAARSAAATRNLGANSARGQTLLFLDDDIVAQPGLVRAHLEAQNTNTVILGYSKPMLPEHPSWWQYDVHRWWEDTFRTMRQPGYRFTYRDFLSGNVSMPAALYHSAGGFDASLTGRREDYEFGMRLLESSARFRFVPQALGYHHDIPTLDQWLRRVRQEGAGDVQIGRRHPELRTTLFGVGEPETRRIRLVRSLAFDHPRWGDRLVRLMLRQAALYERLRLRGHWLRVTRLLREYDYWRGVAGEIGGQKALAAWLQEGSLPPAIAPDAPVVDLVALPPTDTLKCLLERGTHVGLRLALGGVEVLTIPPQPGAEPLREEHLHNRLQQVAEQDFVPALALHLIQSNARGGSICRSN